MSETGSSSAEGDQDGLYQAAVHDYGLALNRLARGYEADAEKRRDLLQEIHLQLWRSFANFNGRLLHPDVDLSGGP